MDPEGPRKTSDTDAHTSADRNYGKFRWRLTSNDRGVYTISNCKVDGMMHVADYTFGHCKQNALDDRFYWPHEKIHEDKHPKGGRRVAVGNKDSMDIMSYAVSWIPAYIVSVDCNDICTTIVARYRSTISPMTTFTPLRWMRI